MALFLSVSIASNDYHKQRTKVLFLIKKHYQFVSGLFGQLNRCLSLREIAMGISNRPNFCLTSVWLKARQSRIWELETASATFDETTLVTDIVNISDEKTNNRRGVDNFHYPKATIVVDDRGCFDC